MLAKRQKKEGQDGLDISLEFGQARIRFQTLRGQAQQMSK
jgi:hypothetical protein